MLEDYPKQLPGKPPSRWWSILIGAGIGLVVGAAWTAVFGPLTDGPPSVWLSLAVYTSGFGVTGALVGAVRRSPELVGLSAGFLTLAVLAVIVGPKDGWLMLWVLVFGGSGLIWGAVIGVLFRFLGRRKSSEPVAELDRGRIPVSRGI